MSACMSVVSCMRKEIKREKGERERQREIVGTTAISSGRRQRWGERDGRGGV